MPFAPVVMLPQVPLSGLQPPASAKPIPRVPLALPTSYGIALPRQSLSVLNAPDERDCFLAEKQVCSQLPFSLSACVSVRPSPCEMQVWRLSDFQTVPAAFEAFAKISAVPSDLRRWHGSKREAGPAARPSQDSRTALLLRSETGWLPWEAPWQLWLGL